MDSRVFFGHATQGTAARAGADVGLRVHRQMLHAGFVPQDGAARDGGRRVHRQHRHAVPLPDQVQAQRFNEGGLAHARHAADAQAKGAPGVRQHGGQQFVGLQAVVGTRRFEQRDRLGHGAALRWRLAVQQALQDLVRAHEAQPWAFLICSSTSLALATIGVPGP